MIYTVRRQDFIVDSIFKQWVASFDTQYNGDPVHLSRDEVSHLFYSKVIDSWEALVGPGRVVVIPYLEGNFQQTMAALAAAVQVDVSHIGFQFDKIANPSLEGYCLRFKHYINGLIRTGRLMIVFYRP